MFPKTFCILPFTQMMINNNGKAELCCRSSLSPMSEEHNLSLHQKTTDEIWNSNYFRLVRRLMVDGKAVDACTQCYQTEADGGQSLRQIMNTTLRSQLGLSEDHQLFEHAKRIVQQKRGFAPPPLALHLWLGNFCNLKCRMCSPLFSSRIASDSVQSKWFAQPSRSENLLPFFLNGVHYNGFGELVKRGKKFTRLMPMGSATITLPANGDPIDWLLISGWKYGTEECHISVRTEGQILIEQWLPCGRWQVWFKPEVVWQPINEIQMILIFQGIEDFIEIDQLTLTTKPILQKGQVKEILSRIPDNSCWSNDKEIIFEEILAHAESLKSIQISGGEPLIHRQFSTILEYLAETNNASHISLYITSNGTRYSSYLSSLFKKFAQVELGISIDGINELQEYIRYLTNWKSIQNNIFAFQKDNIAISVRPSIQSYNIFGLLDLVRWCDQHKLPFFLDNVVWTPQFLSPDMLPQMIIDEAITLWTDYQENECLITNRAQVDTLIATLKRPRPESKRLGILQDEFIRFTSEIDQSRQQSLAIVCPQLYERLKDANGNFSSL